MKGGDREEV